MKYKIARIIIISLTIALSSCSLISSDSSSSDNAAPTALETDLLNRGLAAYDDDLYSIARERFTELRDSFPASPYVAFVELKIADSYFASRDYEAAFSAYDEFLRNFSGNEAAHYAYFQTGLSQLRQYRGSLHEQSPINSAVKIFNEFVNKYPNSYLVAEAKEYSLICQEELAKHELEISRFYARQDQLEAGATRLAQAQIHFSTTKAISSAEDEVFGDLDNKEVLLKLSQEKKRSLDLTSQPQQPKLLAVFDIKSEK